jgi:hypothetical protein
MALHLTERLTDEATAGMVEFGIEYDPKPPHSRIFGATWTGTGSPRSWPSGCGPPWLASPSCCTD